MKFYLPVRMKFFLCLFIVFSLSASAQDSVSNVRSILTEADSVIIVKHETLLVMGKPGRASTTKEIVINGKPNYSIILQSHKLDPKSIDSLAFILTKNPDGDIVTMNCFESHHTVYIFKKEILSYLDICFGCHRFSRSKDIKTGDHKLTNETWAELESFFARRKIDNKNTF
jgi:hypothetical protein